MTTSTDDRAATIDILLKSRKTEVHETRFRLKVSADQITNDDGFEVLGRDAFFIDVVSQRVDGWLTIFVKKLAKEGHTMVSLRELKEEVNRLLLDHAKKSNSSSSFGERMRHEVLTQVLASAANDPLSSRVPILRSFYEAHFDTKQAIAEGNRS